MNKIAYIDNQAYEMVEGETLIQFLRRHKGEDFVPTLCDAPNLKPFGSCRVCSVDVALQQDGKAKAQASCHTPIMENSYIYPESTRIKALRKNILELVLSDFPEEKFKRNGKAPTELQIVAQNIGITHADIRYPSGKNHFDAKTDSGHAYMRSDLSTCINCYRCVRACDEVQGQFVLSMAGRGFDNHIIKGMDTGFDDSDCVSCGACAQACPTSAITDIYDSKRTVADKVERTVCTYCGVGCNLDVAVKNKEVVSITAPFDAKANSGHTCLKGRYAFSFYNHKDRLTTPLIKRNGKFEKATWDEAYDLIADKLGQIKQQHGPDAIAGISSARCTNEENYLMQKFIRAVIGTNNIDCCARVCHSPTALGMQRAFGTGAATNSVKDLDHTKCILIIGANPTDAHPVTGARMKQRIMKGVPLIIIDPRIIELSKYATYQLQLKPGTNVALLNMMLFYVISDSLVDQKFVDQRTAGYEDFKQSILKLDMNELEKITGVDKELVRKATRLYATSGASMEFHGLGVTEHTQGTFTVQLIADLAMITGNIGRPGVGVNPLRGQNNVQGAADMGCQPHQGAGYLDVTDPEIHQLYESFYGVPVSASDGLKIPQMFEAAREKKLKALWLMGEDIVQTDPNTAAVKAAMESLEFLVVQELFMTETAQYADVILPAATFLEKSGTFTNADRRVQRVNAVVEPLAGTKPDGQIMVEIMNRMGYQQADYHPKTMLEEISQIVPFFAGIKWDELGINGKQWPVDASGKDTDILHVDTFTSGKGNFHFQEWKPSNELVKHGKEFPYVLTTGRKLEHYNCGTMTRRTNNSILLTEDTLVVNPVDAQTKGVHTGDIVCLFSARGKVDLKIEVSEEVKPGILYTTFHFPENMVNNVTSDEHCSESMCPEYKVAAVDFRKARKTENRAIGELA